MANMSYCRFQNTLDDLIDCQEHMDDELEDAAEARAKKFLIRACVEIANDYGDIEG